MHEITLNCYRYLGYKGQHEVDMLTIAEYKDLMKSVALRAVDDMYMLHVQAFKNFQVKAMKGGKTKKPVYDRLDKFFNYKKAVQEVMGTPVEKEEDPKIARLRKYLAEKEEKRR